MRRVAAVDYGRRRIGLAVADPLGISVRGLPTLVRESDDLADAARRTARALREVGTDLAVVGLPLHADGRESETSLEVRRFGALLAVELGREVVYLDEGLSSWAAEEDLKQKGRRLMDARRSGEVDQQAARSLLLSFLREEQRLADAGDPPPGEET